MLRRCKTFQKVMTLCIVVLLALPLNVFAEAAKAEAAKTSITFKEPAYVVPGKRIALNADVKDPAGVKLVRCYFRSTGEADYTFVPMTQDAGSSYSAILPAPAATSKSLEYVVLAVNSNNYVVKTKSVSVPVDSDSSKAVPAYQQAAADGTLQVSTELSQAPQAVAGFSDNVSINVVESSARFGLAAGLGSAAAIAATSGGGAATVAGVGTVAGGSGLSTTSIVAIAAGVAVAAGAGAGVAASSGGGSNSNGNYYLNTIAPILTPPSSGGLGLTEANMIGNWTTSGNFTTYSVLSNGTCSPPILTPVTASLSILSNLTYSYTGFLNPSLPSSGNWSISPTGNFLVNGIDYTPRSFVDSSCSNVTYFGSSEITSRQPLTIVLKLTNNANYPTATITLTKL